eukprot:3409708-Rhodomonas_salina.4
MSTLLLRYAMPGTDLGSLVTRYLSGLEKYTEPLYTGKPEQVIEVASCYIAFQLCIAGQCCTAVRCLALTQALWPSGDAGADEQHEEHADGVLFAYAFAMRCPVLT